MKFLDIFLNIKSEYRSLAHGAFCELFNDEFRECGVFSLLEVEDNRNFKALDFLYWSDEFGIKCVARLDLPNLTFVSVDYDFFKDISVNEFYDRILCLLNKEFKQTQLDLEAAEK